MDQASPGERDIRQHQLAMQLRRQRLDAFSEFFGQLRELRVLFHQHHELCGLRGGHRLAFGALVGQLRETTAVVKGATLDMATEKGTSALNCRVAAREAPASVRFARPKGAHSLRTARSEASNPGFLHEISLNLGIPVASLFQENHQ